MSVLCPTGRHAAQPGESHGGSHADLVAFGSIRPWISTTFGETWQSIPTNTLERDLLDQSIRALVFASPDRLYAGTTGGGVYRFDRSEIDGHVIALTWLVIRPASTSQYRHRYRRGSLQSDRIYITFGGFGDYRRVWFFDGTEWEPAGRKPKARIACSMCRPMRSLSIRLILRTLMLARISESGARRMAG